MQWVPATNARRSSKTAHCQNLVRVRSLQQPGGPGPTLPSTHIQRDQTPGNNDGMSGKGPLDQHCTVAEYVTPVISRHKGHTGVIEVVPHRTVLSERCFVVTRCVAGVLLQEQQ